jgi:hypothetical protein
MAQFEPQAQLFDSAKNGHVPEQVRKAAEDGVKRAHEAYASLSSATQAGTQNWQRLMHANYETVREMERLCSKNAATNIDAAFAAAGAMAAARTFPEAAQLYGKFVQQQWSVGSAQMQELLALSQRSSTRQSA